MAGSGGFLARICDNGRSLDLALRRKRQPVARRPQLGNMRIMINIRISNASDSLRVMQIWRNAVAATHHFLNPNDRDEIEIEVSQFLPAAPLWLATDAEDKPLGFMLLDHAHMDALFIDPACRGQGIGKTLVEYALELHPNLTTEVNEQNEQAVGFYKHLGFVPTGRSVRDGQGRPYPLIHLFRSTSPIAS